MDKEKRVEIDFVNGVLLELFERTLQKFPESGGLLADDRIREVCKFLWPFTNSRQLQTALPSREILQGRLRDRRMLLFLEFVEKERALPVVDMSWDLAARTDEPWIRFRFFLLHWKDGESRPRAIGFRFEPPEGGGSFDKSGSHDYWHAQMIAGFEKGDELLMKIVGQPEIWIPTKQPAIPLPAKSWGDLLAVLLLSIYGAKQLAKLGTGAPFFGDLAERLRGMGIRLSSTLPTSSTKP